MHPKSRIASLAALIMIGTLSPVSGEARDAQVKGYIRNDGTYVQPHVRTSPNSSSFDNYSTQGNSNPYTGQRGSKPAFDDGSGYGSKRPSWDH